MKQFDVIDIMATRPSWNNPGQTAIVLKISNGTKINTGDKKKLESYFRKSYRKYFGLKK